MYEPEVIPRLSAEEVEELWRLFESVSTRWDALDKYLFAGRPWGRTAPEVISEVFYLCDKKLTGGIVRDKSGRIHPRGAGGALFVATDIYHLCNEIFGLYIRTGPGKHSVSWGKPNMSVLGLRQEHLVARAYLEYKDLRSTLNLEKVRPRERHNRDSLRKLETRFATLEKRLRKISFNGLDVTSEEVFNRWRDWRETYKSPELRKYTIRLRFSNRIKDRLKEEGIL